MSKPVGYLPVVHAKCVHGGGCNFCNEFAVWLKSACEVAECKCLPVFFDDEWVKACFVEYFFYRGRSKVKQVYGKDEDPFSFEEFAPEGGKVWVVDNKDSVGFEDAVDFCEDFGGVWYVFEHVKECNAVKCIFGKVVVKECSLFDCDAILFLSPCTEPFVWLYPKNVPATAFCHS